MTVKGIVEIGGKRTKVAKEDIRKLKNILDELSIMHIVDDVTFCSFCKAASRMDRIADAGIYNGKNECNASPENGPRKNRLFEFRELIIPHFYIIDYVSLIQLNDEDAEFLRNLLYGSDN